MFIRLEVLVTLTADTGRLLSKLHQIQPKGEVKFMSGVRIAHVSRPTSPLSTFQVVLMYFMKSIFT